CENTECRTRGWQDSLPAMSGIVSLTSSAPRPNSVGQGQSGCVFIKGGAEPLVSDSVLSPGALAGLGICLCLTAFTMTSMVRDRGKCTGLRSSSIKPSVL